MKTTTFNSIVSVLRGLNSNSGRRSVKEQINDIAKLADDKDYKMIDILINWSRTTRRRYKRSRAY